MDRLAKAVLLSDLADRLRANKSWCGETHLQKAAYILQELLKVPLESEFVLYKHGPFSFDLRDELTAMRADGLMELSPNPYPYGPTFVTTQRAERLRERFPKTRERYRPMIEFVADRIGDKGVSDLEKLATALYVTREGGKQESVEKRARRINDLKPHVPFEEAAEAIRTFDRISEEAEKLAHPDP